MSNSKVAIVVNKNATYVDMIKHFLSTVVSTKKGKLLVFIWALGTAGSIGLGIGNRIYRKRYFSISLLLITYSLRLTLSHRA